MAKSIVLVQKFIIKLVSFLNNSVQRPLEGDEHDWLLCGKARWWLWGGDRLAGKSEPEESEKGIHVRVGSCGCIGRLDTHGESDPISK